jgi:hypothetical protein
MNYYIVIHNINQHNYWDCSRSCHVPGPNFNDILSKFICAYCKIYDNAILITSKDPILEELNNVILTLSKERNGVYLLFKVDPLSYHGYSYSTHIEWIQKFFKKEEKVDNTCMDKSISAFDYTEIK